MPLKINGTSIPYTTITTILVAAMWMGGLSYKVNANGDEIQKQAETKERLVRIEERQESSKEDIGEIKTEQKEQGKQLDANSVTLAKILEKVSE